MNHLFSPLSIRSLRLKNRVVVSPMQQYSATDGLPNDWHLVHLGSRAVGGAGLIITECVAVAKEGMNTSSDLGIWTDQQAEQWQRIIGFVHEQNSKIGIQLWHAGAKGSRTHPNDGMQPLAIVDGGWITRSSSATPVGGIVPVALSVLEIRQIITDFVAAARRAVQAGFDTIELHAAHGYLFHQFYSQIINKRKDEYGGSFENRVRFLVETVQEVRKVIPDAMPLLLRLSAVDYVSSEDGWTLPDSIKLAKMLKDQGVDLITASGGGFVPVDPSIVVPGYQVSLATTIKKHTPIAVGAVGMITGSMQANEIIVSEQADLVVMAREHLRNPYFSLHAAIELGIQADIPWQYKRAF